MKILVTGAYGQLGKELCRQLGDDALPVDIDQIDLARLDTIADAVTSRQPDAVIHCAAYTQVDRAEAEAELCRTINAAAVERIASACARLDCPLVQVSTDYLFGAAGVGRPWREDDPTSPQGVYAQTKLAAEQAAAVWPKHFIVRTCGLYAPPSDAAAKNFVKTMLRLADGGKPLRVVNDQQCTPTYVPHLARALLFLVGWPNGAPAAWGVYHVTNRGQTTWCEFARTIFALAGKQVTVEPITSAEFNAPAPRPSYSVLDTTKYHCLGGPAMPTWDDALREYFDHA